MEKSIHKIKGMNYHMPDISTITLSNGKTYNIKDSVARSITAGAIRVIGKTTTVISDESRVNPITIAGNSYTATINDAVFFGKKEFVYDGDKWHEFGDMTGLGSLAQKNSASGAYTPEGTVSAPIFTGTQMTSTGKFTPSGNITAAQDPAGNYQPEGNVSAPTIRVKTAGSVTTVNSITDVGELPALNIVVDEETENMAISFNRGTLPTKGENTLVKTGDAEYESSAPEFTGAKVQLAFSGDESNVNVSGTPEGDISSPAFTGTEATITVT